MATAPSINAIIRSRMDGRRRSTTNAVPDIKRPPAARAATAGTVKAYHIHGIRLYVSQQICCTKGFNTASNTQNMNSTATQMAAQAAYFR